MQGRSTSQENKSLFLLFLIDFAGLLQLGNNHQLTGEHKIQQKIRIRAKGKSVNLRSRPKLLWNPGLVLCNKDKTAGCQ